MRTKTRILAVISVSAGMLVACPKDQEPAKTEKAVEKAAEKPIEKPAAMAGDRKMANCPSSVIGATTRIENGDGALFVTITGDDKIAEEIRGRAKHLVDVSVKNPTEIKHSGEGEGGGGLGSCPVVLADTVIVSEDVPGGAKVTVKPAKPEDFEKLKAVSNERLAKMTASK